MRSARARAMPRLWPIASGGASSTACGSCITSNVEPRRFAILFPELARTPRLGEVLLKEDCERTMSDRLYLYRRALHFGLRSFACRG